MHCRPEVLLNHTGRKPRVSVILIDWGVRESFHSLRYLNRQTVRREDYELIWLEFYDRKPAGLRELVEQTGDGRPALEKWIVLGYPDDFLYHKHRLYNVGILAAEGDICVICDSDAMFRPTFIEKLLAAFSQTPGAVVHLDEVRNVNRAYYPFNYPDFDALLGEGCINWQGHTTLGLDASPDRIHHANYGACMAARRKDLLAIGGADEHPDYLGYVCGPYEMTIRLLNYGRTERWLEDEWLFHTWHPNQYGWNTDYHGPHDGCHLALLALEARATFRIAPFQRNPWFPRTPWGKAPPLGPLLRRVAGRDEPGWKAGAQPPPGERVYWVERDHYGFDVYYHDGTWYALRAGAGRLDPAKVRRGGYRELWQGATQAELRDRLPVDRRQWEHARNQAGLPARLWRKFRSQPLRQLPGRLARKARRLLAS